MDLEKEFLEEYKRLDKLCKDCQNSNQSVTTYIEQMERYSPLDYRHVKNWEYYLETLKHLCHTRNTLAHEPGPYPYDLEPDIEDVKSFYDSILNCTDPLTLIEKSMKEQEILKRKLKQEQKAQEDNITEVPKKSLWQRFVEKIRS